MHSRFTNYRNHGILFKNEAIHYNLKSVGMIISQKIQLALIEIAGVVFFTGWYRLSDASIKDETGFGLLFVLGFVMVSFYCTKFGKEELLFALIGLIPSAIIGLIIHNQSAVLALLLIFSVLVYMLLINQFSKLLMGVPYQWRRDYDKLKSFSFSYVVFDYAVIGILFLIEYGVFNVFTKYWVK